ncbi:unnamed protein product [Paramecium octaurelia]|uniref:Insulin-like growth factor binding protein, N-terminal n=1 Tax=Paramecium octaurelia TaxID=43137 RepID=A0A8S1WSF8_PAROT|nr:unnamed protein product [Paramecium octaurelia]
MFSILIVQFTIISATYTYIAKNDGNLDGWLIQNSQSQFTTNCGGVAMLGGISSFNENTVIKRIFSGLQPHYQLRLDFWIWIIDASSITDIEVQLDQEDYAQSVSSQVIEQSNYCGLTNQNETIKLVSFTLGHNIVQAIVFVKFKYHEYNRIQWGMQQMQLSLDLCSIECSYCTGPLKSDCQTWQTMNHRFPLGLFSNKIIFNSQINEFSQNYECQKCDSILILDLVQTTITTPILRQNLSFHNDIIFEVYNNGTFIIHLIQKYGIAEFNLRLYSRWDQDTQQLLFQYQINYHLEETFFPFISGCQDYFDKECLQCLQGWELNLIEQLCYPVCGNNKIDGYEECDDDNFSPFDGCFECKYQCIKHCDECNYGICEKCEFGYKYDEKRKLCLPICQEGVVPVTENFCEDGCCVCQIGFQLKNGVCNPICGDKIVLPDLEECDDGNNNSEECHECKLVCEEGCEICEKGICKLNCQKTYGIGFYFVDENCKQICGDSIVTAFEECDDGNDIEFDGCFNCKYSFEQNFLDCKGGQCSQYQSSCGDAKLQDQEECDDGNNDLLDGCFNCAVEPGWSCIQILQKNTFCKIINPPQLISKFLSIQNNKQLVLLQFSQEIKVLKGCNLTESLVFNILNISNSEYLLTYVEKEEPLEGKVQEAYYIIQIEINTQTLSKPLLIIDLNATILNNDNEKMQQLQYELQLEFSQYLTPKQREQSNKIKNINSFFIYGQIAIGGCFFLIGQPDILFKMLDVLQQFSYLRYLKVTFPINLEIFFQISDQITFSLLYELINFEEILNQFVPLNYMSPSLGKFLQYDQNADLLSNIIPQMIQGLIFITIYNIQEFLLQISLLNYDEYKIVYLLDFFAIQNQLHRSLIKVQQYHYSQQITNLMIINGWDLIFKCFLYLKSFENYSNRKLISIVLASQILAFYGYLILKSMGIGTMIMKSHKCQNLEQRFVAFDLIKQIILLYALIFIDQSEIIQIAILFANCLISMLIILKKKRSNLQLNNFISIILSDGSILLFIFICLIYTKDFPIYFSVENKIITGWINIFLLSFIIALPIINLAKDFSFWMYKQLRENGKQKKQIHRQILLF